MKKKTKRSFYVHLKKRISVYWDGSGIEFDKDQFLNMMGGASSLTLEEYLVYAEAPSVEDFYYTLTAYFNGSEGFEAITTSSTSNGGSSFMPGGIPDFMSGMGADGSGQRDNGKICKQSGGTPIGVPPLCILSEIDPSVNFYSQKNHGKACNGCRIMI